VLQKHTPHSSPSARCVRLARSGRCEGLPLRLRAECFLFTVFRSQRSAFRALASTTFILFALIRVIRGPRFGSMGVREERPYIELHATTWGYERGLLVGVVNFEQNYPGGFVFSSDDEAVHAGWQCHQQGR